jgi:hypothetical protein
VKKQTLYWSPLVLGGYVPRPQWMSETTNRIKLYIFYAFFPYINTPMIKFNLSIRYNKRLAIIDNKIEQL